MKPRHRRLLMIVLALAALATATALVLRALNANVMFFFSPSQVHAREAPRQAAFRLGGLVEPASLQRGGDGMTVRFVVTDQVQRVPVQYRGILPDLFKEGKGVVAAGRLDEHGNFVATEVLAKHDENYMPPEAAAALADAHRNGVGQNQKGLQP
ncbi:cytochrome c-type biogenesis protein CcmE [Roseateles sp. YR242]|uniref:cytochrome c maturation protein CcmE n=1 Tax=Roseateles sp. YR242 TaxID=1855305 RepID=UPI0008BD2C4B|nr:cytochrome c maturation protein CcmE [Roseateles sp. YR242]SEK97691.1 cytochrome c-type biogenesis protein CcmE [Roseateles sp. YR242]